MPRPMRHVKKSARKIAELDDADRARLRMRRTNARGSRRHGYRRPCAHRLEIRHPSRLIMVNLDRRQAAEIFGGGERFFPLRDGP